jgi:hypothetical protein
MIPTPFTEGRPVAFIVGIIVMTAITEYQRYRQNILLKQMNDKYEKQVNDLLDKYHRQSHIHARTPKKF